MNEATVADATGDLFLTMARGFIGFPDHLKAEMFDLSASVQINVDAHADDVPKLIGSAGVMHQSLLCVLKYFAKKRGKDVRLKINEATIGHRMPLTPFAGESSFTDAQVEELFDEIGRKIFHYPYDVWVRDVGSTVIELQIDDKESRIIPDAQFGEALSRVMNAIGKSKGREIILEMTRATRIRN